MGLTVIIDGPSAIPSSTYVLDRPKHAWRLPETTIYSMLSTMDHPEYFLFYPGWPSHEKVLEVYLILVFFRSNSNGYFLVFLVFTLQRSSFWVSCFLLKWKLSLIYNHTLVSFFFSQVFWFATALFDAHLLLCHSRLLLLWWQGSYLPQIVKKEC